MHVRSLFDLSGRHALVTGGGRGIGRHVAIGLAEAGARVTVASRKREACEETAAAIRAAGGDAQAFEADLAEPAACERLMAEVLASGRLDVLVNNAARVWAAPTLDYPLEGWDRVFALNVRAAFRLSQLAARHMALRGGGGSIVQVGSISAWRAGSEESQPVVAYNASKGALVSLAIDLAVKLAPHQIRVNCLVPGPFDTDMMNHIRHDPERMKQYLAHVPLGRIGGEDDVKAAAVFLASDASRYVTGQTLVVDGGVSAVYPARG